MSGPSTLNTVRTPSSRRTGAAWRKPGWWAGAKMKPKPSSSIDCAILSGSSSSSKPSASSTSADPEADETARLPCFATAAPAAAATRAAAVEMFSVRAPSPPVPAVSTRSSRSGVTGTTCARMASAQPAISSAVSPFARRATRKPAVWDGVASPDMISSMAALRLGRVEIVAVEQLGDRLLDHRVASRKFRSRSRPSGSVSTDSGWNCTPSTGSVRCLTPITSPSSDRADTSSSSGMRVAASEW